LFLDFPGRFFFFSLNLHDNKVRYLGFGW